MNIDKDQILQLLRSQGKDDQPARPAASSPTRSTPATPSTLGCSRSTASIPAASPTSSAAWAISSDRTKRGADTWRDRPCMPLPPDRRAGQEAPDARIATGHKRDP